jgi:hypothetical protein
LFVCQFWIVRMHICRGECLFAPFNCANTWNFLSPSGNLRSELLKRIRSHRPLSEIKTKQLPDSDSRLPTRKRINTFLVQHPHAHTPTHTPQARIHHHHLHHQLIWQLFNRHKHPKFEASRYLSPVLPLSVSTLYQPVWMHMNDGSLRCTLVQNFTDLVRRWLKQSSHVAVSNADT